MTFRSATCERSVSTSSCTPSAKNALSLSSEKLSNGSTATDLFMGTAGTAAGAAAGWPSGCRRKNAVTSAAGRTAVSTHASRTCGVRGNSGRPAARRFLLQAASSVAPRPNASTIIKARNTHVGAPKPGSTMADTCRTIQAPTR